MLILFYCYCLHAGICCVFELLILKRNPYFNYSEGPVMSCSFAYTPHAPCIFLSSYYPEHFARPRRKCCGWSPAAFNRHHFCRRSEMSISINNTTPTPLYHKSQWTTDIWNSSRKMWRTNTQTHLPAGTCGFLWGQQTQGAFQGAPAVTRRCEGHRQARGRRGGSNMKVTEPLRSPCSPLRLSLLLAPSI